MEIQEEPIAPVARPRYFMHMAYEGTAYHGWQRQPNAHSVQAEMEAALAKLLRQHPVITTGCGRTDAGVHASCFYLHFDADKEIEDMRAILRKMNMLLPPDIAVYNIFRMPDRAHTRYDAIERTYEYHIHQRRDPFLQFYSRYYPWELDIDQMNAAGAILLNYRDFAAFAKTGGGQKTTICDVRHAMWERRGHRLIFTITADRFLRNMVRAVVGTMMDLGRGKITLEQFENIVREGKRTQAGESVPPRGLTLTRVIYPYELPAAEAGAHMF
jgi:tRNA pseudouridine38-40 synthase